MREPAAMRDGTLHVESTGCGPPVVLLHGWAMHSGLWGPLIPRLAERHRVLAADLPGHGYSAPMEAFTLDSTASALAEHFSARSEPLTVLGWSLGGLIAIRWALAHPAQVARIVLLSASPRMVEGDDWPCAMSSETLAKFGDELRVAWKLTIQRFLSLQVQGSENGRAILSSMRAGVYARGAPAARALFDGLEIIRTTDLRAEVGDIRQPALVIAGGRDKLAFPEAGRWLAGRLQNSHLTFIEGAAHTPFLSHADTVGEALDRFLDGR